MTDTNKPRVRPNGDGTFTMTTVDGLQNVVIGMGTGRDSRSASSFTYSPNYQNWGEFEAAYAENWIARAIVDAPVDDATREWREFDTEEGQEIEAAEEKLGVQQAVQKAFKAAGLYGGALIIMMTDQPLDQPLSAEKVKKNGLKSLLVLDRSYVSAVDVNMTDPLATDYMMPSTYMLNGGKQAVHHSHVIRVPGAELPMRLRGLNGWWDDSHLRRSMEDLKDVVSSKSGMAKLIQQANIDIINKKGFYNAVSSGDQEQQIANRYSQFNLMKSIFGLGLLDEEEVYSRNQVSFGGLADVLRVMMEWTSGASGIPMTRLFGVQAKGLGNDNSGDSRYKLAMKKLDEVLVRSALGHMPDDYSWRWRPLEQLDPNELADRQKTQAEKDDIRIEQGLPRSVVFRRLQAEGEYDIDDEVIEQVERDEKAEREGEALSRTAPEVETEPASGTTDTKG